MELQDEFRTQNGGEYRPCSSPRKVETQAEFKSTEGGSTSRIQGLLVVEVQAGLRFSEDGNTGRVQGLGRWGSVLGKSNAKQYGTFDEVGGGVVLVVCFFCGLA